MWYVDRTCPPRQNFQLNTYTRPTVAILQYLQLSQQDSDLLLLYQTQSLLAGHFRIEVKTQMIYLTSGHSYLQPTYIQVLHVCMHVVSSGTE